MQERRRQIVSIKYLGTAPTFTYPNPALSRENAVLGFKPSKVIVKYIYGADDVNPAFGDMVAVYCPEITDGVLGFFGQFNPTYTGGVELPTNAKMGYNSFNFLLADLLDAPHAVFTALNFTMVLEFVE